MSLKKQCDATTKFTNHLWRIFEGSLLIAESETGMIILAQVVKERESIRTLCDKLRRERDRAVSELAEALRDLDEVKKNRNEVGIFTHPHPFD